MPVLLEHCVLSGELLRVRLSWRDEEELSLPEPGEDQVLVRLEAIGVNFIDTYQRSGLYPVDLPFTPGMEGAGVVEKTGAGVAAFAAGDRVAYAGVRGAYAEQTLVPADKLVLLPQDVSTEEGAAVMLQGMTAHSLALSTYP